MYQVEIVGDMILYKQLKKYLNKVSPFERPFILVSISSFIFFDMYNLLDYNCLIYNAHGSMCYWIKFNI